MYDVALPHVFYIHFVTTSKTTASLCKGSIKVHITDPNALFTAMPALYNPLPPPPSPLPVTYHFITIAHLGLTTERHRAADLCVLVRVLEMCLCLADVYST